MKNQKNMNNKKRYIHYQADGNLIRVVFLTLFYFEFIFSFLLYFVPFSGIILQVLKFKIIAPSSNIHEYIYAQLAFVYIKMEPIKFVSRFIANLLLKILLSYNKNDYDIYQYLTVEQCYEFRSYLKLEQKKIKKLQSKKQMTEKKIQSRLHNNPMLSKSTIL